MCPIPRRRRRYRPTSCAARVVGIKASAPAFAPRGRGRLPLSVTLRIREAERFFLSTKRLSRSSCPRGGEMTLPCPGGQGGAAVCACDAVCPAGKSAAEWRAGYGCIAEKQFHKRFAHQGGLCRRAGEREALPPSLPRQRFPPAVPRGERRTLPAPAQGIHPLGIPFWGTGLIFPRLPSPKTPQAASPCSWACRRLPPSPPHAERNEAPMPPTRGAWVRVPRAEGTG